MARTVSVCVEDKTTNSAECFCHKELDFGIRVVTPVLSTTRERDQRRGTGSRTQWSLACKKTGCAWRVHTVSSDTPVHMPFFSAKANPLSMSPLFQTEFPVSQCTCCCSLDVNRFPAAIDQTLSRHPVAENAQHQPHCSLH